MRKYLFFLKWALEYTTKISTNEEIWGIFFPSSHNSCGTSLVPLARYSFKTTAVHSVLVLFGTNTKAGHVYNIPAHTEAHASWLSAESVAVTCGAGILTHKCSTQHIWPAWNTHTHTEWNTESEKIFFFPPLWNLRKPLAVCLTCQGLQPHLPTVTHISCEELPRKCTPRELHNPHSKVNGGNMTELRPKARGPLPEIRAPLPWIDSL